MESISDMLFYGLLGGSALVLSIITIYVFRVAFVVLQENGATVKFPMIKNMARNNKTVSIIMLLIVLTGIIWAIQFKV